MVRNDAVGVITSNVQAGVDDEGAVVPLGLTGPGVLTVVPQEPVAGTVQLFGVVCATAGPCEAAGDAYSSGEEGVVASLPATQTISFSAPVPGVVGTSAMLSATGGASGSPVVFSVDASSGAGVCNVSGTNGTAVNYTAPGDCVVDANQAGDADYSAAPQVQQTITVSQPSPPSFGGSPPAPTTTTTVPTTSTTLPTTTTTRPPSSPTSVPAPQIGIVSSKAKVVNGHLPVELSCRVATCSGTVTIFMVKKQKTVILAGATYKFLGAGRADILQLQVTVAGAARFSRGKTVKDRCIATVHGGLILGRPNKKDAVGCREHVLDVMKKRLRRFR